MSEIDLEVRLNTEIRYHGATPEKGRLVYHVPAADVERVIDGDFRNLIKMVMNSYNGSELTDDQQSTYESIDEKIKMDSPGTPVTITLYNEHDEPIADQTSAAGEIQLDDTVYDKTGIEPDLIGMGIDAGYSVGGK